MPFSRLAERVAEVREKIDAARKRGGHGQDVRIIAVTKTHGPDAVLAALAAGLSDIGENKVQEAIRKQDQLSAERSLVRQPTWHLIGHLQRNKVKFLDRFSVFHAVDSTRLAEAIDDFGRAQTKPVDVLIEANVSGEESKGGFSLEQLQADAPGLLAKRGLRVQGVMTMAPFEAQEKELRAVFAGAREAQRLLREAGLPAHELSMGMSGDYEIAVEEGATIVRLGTVLFGERDLKIRPQTADNRPQTADNRPQTTDHR